MRLMQGFNNEHPNAKRAAVMKKKDWVRCDTDHAALFPMLARTFTSAQLS